jgi:hypothetical protein
MRGLKREENEEPNKMMAFQKPEALAGQRFDRDKLVLDKALCDDYVKARLRRERAQANWIRL